MVQQDGGVTSGEIEPVHKLGDAVVHDEVDCPAGLVISLRKIQTDGPVLFHEGQVHSITLVGDAVAVQIVAEAV